ncbi:Uncharacterised protein [uncultured archaeon]|nr:Uncharacterised protein [uncultured archaeon]
MTDQDITDLLFEGREPTEEEKRKEELWRKATQRAYKLVGSESPMRFLRKTEEMFRGYLKTENLHDDDYHVDGERLRQ